MRIRKAEKLLGFTSENRAAPSPPTPWDSAAVSVAAARLLCEISRSCCFDDSINLYSSNRQKEELAIANDDEEGIGVVGKGFDDKVGRDKHEEKVEDKEETKNEKEPARKRREKEEEATGKIKSKKINGKRWHCNLKPLSSYCSRLEDENISCDDECRRRTNCRKKSAAAVEAATGTAYNYFDNHYGLGIDSRESAIGGNGSSDLDDVSDRKAFADGLNGADNERVESGNLCSFNSKKKTRPLKKRGRKPVKARSLKSLLSF